MCGHLISWIICVLKGNTARRTLSARKFKAMGFVGMASAQGWSLEDEPAISTRGGGLIDLGWVTSWRSRCVVLGILSDATLLASIPSLRPCHFTFQTFLPSFIWSNPFILLMMLQDRQEIDILLWKKQGINHPPLLFPFISFIHWIPPNVFPGFSEQKQSSKWMHAAIRTLWEVRGDSASPFDIPLVVRQTGNNEMLNTNFEGRRKLERKRVRKDAMAQQTNTSHLNDGMKRKSNTKITWESAAVCLFKEEKKRLSACDILV